MELNQTDMHYLIAAICVISSALVFYTVGVWGERLQKKLKSWHIAFFLFGLVADAVGTSLMEHLAEQARLERESRIQQAALSIKRKFGKNALVKGMDLQEDATAMTRNNQIGGHRA